MRTGGSMSFSEPVVLGKTGLKAGRLGISSSFGAPAACFEEAFERGCNYFNWGTFIKGRSSQMKTAIKNIVQKGKRDDLILGMLTYAHMASLTEKFFIKGLKALEIDYADVLLLGYFSKRPSQRIIDGAMKLKEKGLVRYTGITSHNRKLFKQLNDEGLFDVYHIRYNAANSGGETDTFPYLTGNDSERPGIVSFTATRWGKLLQANRMPKGEPPMTAVDCYRFVLSNPAIDVCMMGAKNEQQFKENMATLEKGPMTDEEMKRARRIGDFVYGKKRNS